MSLEREKSKQVANTGIEGSVDPQKKTYFSLKNVFVPSHWRKGGDSSSEEVNKSTSRESIVVGSCHKQSEVVIYNGPKAVDEKEGSGGVEGAEKEALFDRIAENYYKAIPELPEEYIDLLLEISKIRRGSKVAEVGSGNGKAAIRFAASGAKVTGIDPSEKMIKMAKKKDLEESVSWVKIAAEDFEFGEGEYDLIFTHDSFHLIKHPDEVIKKIVRGLKPGGIFVFGSTDFAFDTHAEASKAIDRVYSENVPDYKDGSWGDWEPEKFVMKMLKQRLLVALREVSVESTHTVEQMAISSANVSRTARLNETERAKIADAFRKELVEIFPDGECHGNNVYTVVYGQKPKVAKKKNRFGVYNWSI